MPFECIKRFTQPVAIIFLWGCLMSVQASHASCNINESEKAHTIKSLSSLLKSQKNTPFEPIDRARYQHAKALFRELLSTLETKTENESMTALPDELNTLASLAGFCPQWLVVKYQKQNHQVLLLMEQKDSAKGQGAYLFAMNKPLTLVIQAPHQFYDYGTGYLALQLFFEQNLRAVALNTVHRNQTDQSDLAHQAHSLFSAFTEALPGDHPDRYLLQIHGFSNQHRTSPAGKVADIILSNGSRSPSAFLTTARTRMAQHTGFKTYLYGADIDELGGTQNSSLAVLAHANQQHQFIHLELSSETRKKLKVSQALRDALWSSWP